MSKRTPDTFHTKVRSKLAPAVFPLERHRFRSPVIITQSRIIESVLKYYNITLANIGVNAPAPLVSRSTSGHISIMSHVHAYEQFAN